MDAAIEMLWPSLSALWSNIYSIGSALKPNNPLEKLEKLEENNDEYDKMCALARVVKLTTDFVRQMSPQERQKTYTTLTQLRINKRFGELYVKRFPLMCDHVDCFSNEMFFQDIFLCIRVSQIFDVFVDWAAQRVERPSLGAWFAICPAFAEEFAADLDNKKRIELATSIVEDGANDMRQNPRVWTDLQNFVRSVVSHTPLCATFLCTYERTSDILSVENVLDAVDAIAIEAVSNKPLVKLQCCRLLRDTLEKATDISHAACQRAMHTLERFLSESNDARLFRFAMRILTTDALIAHASPAATMDVLKRFSSVSLDAPIDAPMHAPLDVASECASAKDFPSGKKRARKVDNSADSTA